MLRASAEAAGERVNLAVINDRSVDPGIVGGRLFTDLVEAAFGRGDLAQVVREVEDIAGAEALVDAAAVMANFEMMNRVADAIGMPVGRGMLSRTAALRAEGGLDRYDPSG